MDLSATYTGVDPDLLESIVLAYLPEGEYTLSGRYVESMAERKGVEVTLESSEITVRVVQGSPVEISIHTTEVPTSVSLIASEVLDFIADDLSLPRSCMDSTLVRYSGEPGEGEPYIRYSRFPTGRVVAYLSFLKEGRVDSSMSLEMIVSCERKVYRAKRIIRMGDTLYPDVLEEATVDVFKVRGTPIYGPKVFYSVARRLIDRGEVITSESIKRKPDVYRGQIILAYVELPGIRVSALVEVLKEGYIGDMIRARNISTGRPVTGILEAGPVLRIVEVRR